MMTKERAEKLTAVLAADPEKTNAWLDLEPAEAVTAVNAGGHDFTVEELVEYCEAMKVVAAQSNGELSSDALEEVAGGILPSFCVFAAAAVGMAVVGYVQAKKSRIKW